MNERIRWGIIGTGWRADTMAEGLAVVEDATLVASGQRRKGSNAGVRQDEKGDGAGVRCGCEGKRVWVYASTRQDISGESCR